MNTVTIRRFPLLGYACSEAVNTLCTNLSFAGDNVRKIMITSCHASEGKSFLAMNIMRTMAMLGKTVAFVDADLRRSAIASMFGLQFARKDPPGLAHFLAGMVKESEIVYATNIPGAYMVPIGREVGNSLPLLVSPHLDELLNNLSQKVDYVIVDAPPLGAIIDAAEIAKSCDGTLIVVNYDSVRRQELINVKEQLEQTECPILGTVLNMVEFDNYLSKKYYYKSYYSDGYGDYDTTKSSNRREEKKFFRTPKKKKS